MEVDYVCFLKTFFLFWSCYNQRSKVVNFIARYLREKKRYSKNKKTFLKGNTGTFERFDQFSEKKLIRDVI